MRHKTFELSIMSKVGVGHLGVTLERRYSSLSVMKGIWSSYSNIQVQYWAPSFLLWALRCLVEVHGYVMRLELQANSFISSALLDTYSKWGRLDISIQVFNDSSFWNTMISAFGLHGHGEKAIKIFTTMTQLGIQPTKGTFIALLSACSHSGLLDEGCSHYNLMKKEFGFESIIEHNVCMIDMLSKAGKICEAYNFVHTFSSRAEPGSWGAILSPCTDHTKLLKSGTHLLIHRKGDMYVEIEV